MRTTSALLILTTIALLSVVPRKWLPGLVPAFPVNSQPAISEPPLDHEWNHTGHQTKPRSLDIWRSKRASGRRWHRPRCPYGRRAMVSNALPLASHTILEQNDAGDGSVHNGLPGAVIDRAEGASQVII